MSTISRLLHRLAHFDSRLDSLLSSHIFILVYPGLGAVCYRISILVAQSLLPQLRLWMIVTVIYWKLLNHRLTSIGLE